VDRKVDLRHRENPLSQVDFLNDLRLPQVGKWKKIPQTEIQRHNKNDKIMKFIFDFQGRLPQVEFLNKNPKQKTQKKKKHNNEIDKKMTGGCRMLIF